MAISATPTLPPTVAKAFGDGTGLSRENILPADLVDVKIVPSKASSVVKYLASMFGKRGPLW